VFIKLYIKKTKTKMLIRLNNIKKPLGNYNQESETKANKLA
jgi:hypothetical protein